MKIIKLHNKAMEIADLADLEKCKGNTLGAASLYENAYQFEKEAAIQAFNNKIEEPQLSILLRSAASLAIDCNKIREAEKLIAMGLSGEPPFEIAEELRDLLENVNFNRHLSLRNIKLSDNEIQLVIAGKSVGYGFAEAREATERIDMLNNLAVRTLERKTNKPFRKSGNVSNELKNFCTPYLSVPRAASMAFTIRFGSLYDSFLEGFSGYESVISDIITNIDLLNENKIENIYNNINDEAYFSNFMSLAQALAPDGENINLFGITSNIKGVEKKTVLTKKRSAISDIIKENIKEEDVKAEILSVEGILKAANARKNTVQIIVDNKNITMRVPDGLNDIVKKYWDSNVRVEYETKNNRLINIINLS